MLKTSSNVPKVQRRNPEATRRKLLAAARREFAASGLAGARVDEIAARAGVNKQLVYHYFGDKDALYLTVLEWVYEEIREQERGLNLEGVPPQLAIRKLIEASFDYLAAHPDFVVLLNDENRGGARHVRRSKRLEFAARQHGLADPQTGRAQRNVPQRHRSCAALHFDRGPELFLLLEHADVVSDLRQKTEQPGRAACTAQARRGPGDAVAPAVINQLVESPESSR